MYWGLGCNIIFQLNRINLNLKIAHINRAEVIFELLVEIIETNLRTALSAKGHQGQDDELQTKSQNLGFHRKLECFKSATLKNIASFCFGVAQDSRSRRLWSWWCWNRSFYTDGNKTLLFLFLCCLTSSRDFGFFECGKVLWRTSGARILCHLKFHSYEGRLWTSIWKGQYLCGQNELRQSREAQKGRRKEEAHFIHWNINRVLLQ